MSDSIDIAYDVSARYNLEWDHDSILQLFAEYIDNQCDAGALLDFLEMAASSERDESENNWRGAE